MKFKIFLEEKLKSLSKGKTEKDISKKHHVSTSLIKKQVKMGSPKEKKEHGVKNKKAKSIAMDHLIEDPKYYTKLSKIEK
jgi:hypothetical protein